MLTKEIACKYCAILKEELIPALGCTEPIALAYAAARAREVLGKQPTSCTAEVCGNIIKNVKGVVVPATNGMRGIDVAVLAGVAVGCTDKKLELLANLDDKTREYLRLLKQTVPVKVVLSKCKKSFHISVTLACDDDCVTVTIEDYHSNIVRIEHNGVLLHERERFGKSEPLTDRSCLNIADVYEFADSGDITPLRSLIERQIQCNGAIAEEGLEHGLGAEIGRTLLRYSKDVGTRAKAYAAAGSDARMSGCEMPVVVVSGSGNQGMTASLPVMVYAKELGSTHEQLIRALVLSNLVTIEQKTGIGRLSAYCGAVSAGCGAAAGICYLHGGDFTQVAHTIVNTLAISSGIICDGAKPSCAAKIALAVEAGLTGYRMYLAGNEFKAGEGIVCKGVDNTIANVGRLASKGMKSTDKEILHIMTDDK